MSPAQCKAARSLLGWSVRQLAEEADVSMPTIVNFEAARRRTTGPNVSALRAALERAGVEFIGTSSDEADTVYIELSDGTGVRLKR
ncbi:MAG: helix-turn-helix transcriptional regulator [Myxococcales bacterium]|nr:helix-turn-helix transcriptional regulator [Myxococcales bacterium]